MVLCCLLSSVLKLHYSSIGSVAAISLPTQVEALLEVILQVLHNSFKLS
jgi:hypothetical protein